VLISYFLKLLLVYWQLTNSKYELHKVLLIPIQQQKWLGYCHPLQTQSAGR